MINRYRLRKITTIGLVSVCASVLFLAQQNIAHADEISKPQAAAIQKSNNVNEVHNQTTAQSQSNLINVKKGQNANPKVVMQSLKQNQPTNTIGTKENPYKISYVEPQGLSHQIQWTKNKKLFKFKPLSP